MWPVQLEVEDFRRKMEVFVEMSCFSWSVLIEELRDEHELKTGCDVQIANIRPPSADVAS